MDIRKGHEVEVTAIPPCDVDPSHGAAAYDSRLPGFARSPGDPGPWGNVCASCFRRYGPGKTGVGFAQKLLQRV